MVDVPWLSGYDSHIFVTFTLLRAEYWVYVFIKIYNAPHNMFMQEMQIKIFIFVKLCVLIIIQEFWSFHVWLFFFNVHLICRQLFTNQLKHIGNTNFSRLHLNIRILPSLKPVRPEL